MTVINFLLIGYYDWDFTAANYSENLIPRWVWSVAAINILLYYNLGNLLNLITVSIICYIENNRLHLFL